MLNAGVLLCLLWPLCLSHPLDDYIQKPDDTYEYSVIATHPGDDYDVHVINMTSQSWMTSDFSSQPIWWHYVTIIIPRVIHMHDHALLFISIGQMTDDPPHPDDDPFIPLLGVFSTELGAVATMINQIPNQPITFVDDPAQRARTEDDIIAYTWMNYVNQTEEDKNEEQLLFFPMTKAIVRAFDTISEYTSEVEPSLQLDKYVVTGPSKRGWTTYLSTAVDSRVVAMAPMVISCLNMRPNFHHHYRSLGGWSYTFYDYWREGLTEKIDDPEIDILLYMQDPYVFNDRYTMPKVLIKAANDEFFMLDDTSFFYDDLPGIKYWWVIDNSNHVMLGHWEELVENLISFFDHVYHGYQWPEFTYTLESSETEASITVDIETINDLVNISAWYAFSGDEERRDWRWMKLGNSTDPDDTVPQTGVRYTNDEVEDLGGGRFQITYEAPESGYIGFFISMDFRIPGDRIMRLSTEPTVVPNTFAFEDCVGSECKGELV